MVRSPDAGKSGGILSHANAMPDLKSLAGQGVEVRRRRMVRESVRNAGRYPGGESRSGQSGLLKRIEVFGSFFQKRTAFFLKKQQKCSVLL
jgi:hypothetical protein